ncbi:uncharacterized protein LTR77_008740 [Saxophila tyrrhenica]|uniref:RING-type E3 ubiquitin transferase n=1 Tax=Saxophila tyrrhenica TaxID=1690608 RepID=A0AAV9P0I2_9PEZI|nr:hypothetical protein LTR77_008740 [Saxophila tyrrhenica]
MSNINRPPPPPWRELSARPASSLNNPFAQRPAPNPFSQANSSEAANNDPFTAIRNPLFDPNANLNIEPQQLRWEQFLASEQGQGTAHQRRQAADEAASTHTLPRWAFDIDAAAARADRVATADRKRRHAGSSPERRGYPRPPTYGGVTGRRPAGMSAAEGSARNPFDLTSSSPPRARPQMPQRTSGSGGSEVMRAAQQAGRAGGLRSGTRTPREEARRESDHVLPKWQPDADVSKCPVCQTEFHFFYRKHHCRKCGRVVCNACSPHRITIPKQYIVQPPSGSDGEEAGSTSPGGLFGRNNLGGGDVVRVCNPCVPDPWTPDTAPNLEARHPAEQNNSRRRGSEQPERYRSILPPLPPLPENNGRTRANTHQPAPTPFSRSVPQQRAPIAPEDPRLRLYRHRHSQSGSSSHPETLVFAPPSSARPSMTTAPSAPPQPRQRREIREEDECPVCGTELAPGATAREQHIQSCIAERFSTSVSSSSLPTNTAFAAPTAQQPSRPRASSYRPRGMAVYRATEKDCLSEDGTAQECVICFEEFQPGDEMGRMECLCKFHRGCIRRWWEMRGGGSCPTHVLQEE